MRDKMEEMEKTVEEAKETDKKETNAITPNWIVIESEWSENPIRPGEKDCLFYLNNRLCGFGSECRFNHPPLQEISERIGQQLDCMFFKIGACKRGSTCKFNHPKKRKKSRSQKASESRKEFEDICQSTGDIEQPREMPENHNLEAHDQGNTEEQRKIEIERMRSEARLRLEQIRPTVLFDELSRPRELMKEFGLEDFVGI